MLEIILLSLGCGIGVALLAGPLGCFAVWRQMAYFGDTLAHSALTGVALGLLFSLDLNLSITLVCLFIALLLVVLQNNRTLATDTLLGILSHSMLALGLVVVSVFAETRIDLYAYLFGDILSATWEDFYTIYITVAIVIPLLVIFWRPLLAITVHEELARVEGIPVNAIRTLLMSMMALVIAMAMKIVGVLLITALLIIPAAASRRLVNTPSKMAFVASIIGALAIAGGLALSFWLDTPAGPSAVICATGVFLLTLFRRQPQ